MPENFVEYAASRTRESFIHACPHPFLVGEAVLHQPRPGRTMTFESGTTFSADEQALSKAEPGRRLVLPVRKNHTTFPSMITVGRTKNNDVIISDVLISKLHAFFRIVDGGYDLADAGSQNGTRVGERTLPPKGPGLRVRSGDVIFFAELRFRFLDAGACWEALRAH